MHSVTPVEQWEIRNNMSLGCRFLIFDKKCVDGSGSCFVSGLDILIVDCMSRKINWLFLQIHVESRRVMNIKLGRVRLDVEGVKYELPLNDAFLLHRHAGFDPREAWELRGIKGHDVNQDRLVELRESVLQEIVESEFVAEDSFRRVNELFARLVENPRETIREEFPGTKFYFILGVPRSGGHYLLRNLLQIEGWDLRTFVYGMISDFCPSGRSMLNLHTEEGELFALYEVAQMLTWMEEAYGDVDRVYKKQTVFSFAVPWLDAIFGDQAHYLVTVRHPVTALESKIDYDMEFEGNMGSLLGSTNAEMERPRTVVLRGTDVSEEEWEQLPVWKRNTLRWLVQYTSIVDRGGPEGKVSPIRFGSSMDDFLADFAVELGVDEKQKEGFAPRKRGHEAFVDRDFVQEALDRTQTVWSKHGYEFPSPSVL